MMPAHADDVDLLEQQAWRAAVDSVSDSVVQIRLVGGLDRVGKTLLARGPTTGLIVSEDGYLVSSAFNFAGQPTSILVRLASGQQLPAKIVARDKSRMLVLLKVETDSPLPVAEATPEREMRVGQWAIALGRTFRSDQTDVSVGILSALNRMHGRVLQTDASISAANYGGPLLDIHGRVLGVLIPMAPQAAGPASDSEVAGAEFYDSGIGFAVPLEHVLSIFPQWKEGKDLLPGKLGVGLAKGEARTGPPKITTVWPNSPAATAGWKAGDLIVAIEGHAVETQTQLRFQVTPRYAGEVLNVTILRGDEKIETEVTLAGELAPYRHAFLGILPSRINGSPEGILVGGVWPDSPAQVAGVERGDLLMRIGTTQVAQAAEGLEAMGRLHPKDSVELIVKRGDEELTLTAELGTLPEGILARDELPQRDNPPRNNEEQESRDAAEEELQTLKLPDFSQEARFYLPTRTEDQEPGLLIWLATDGNHKQDESLATVWQASCRRDHFALLIARPADEAGWASADLEYLWRLTRTAKTRWKIDPRRIAIGGQGKAGQAAYALALRRRNTFCGVIGVDAPLPRTLRIPENRPGAGLATLAVESRNSTFAPLLRKDLQTLREAGYSASWLQRKLASDPAELLDAATRNSIARWFDGLDRF
ncbi:MAG: PDZ domain-containing protein [Planctomycetes bacterium]|nr:PDZ domain-containing protein [Planctomycetota bacterium]